MNNLVEIVKSKAFTIVAATLCTAFLLDRLTKIFTQKRNTDLPKDYKKK